VSLLLPAAAPSLPAADPRAAV